MNLHKKTLTGASEFWAALSGGQKFLMVFLGLVCAGAAAAVFAWSTRTEYQIVFSGLAMEESVEVMAALEDAGIPARMSGGGGAIYAPKNMRDKAMMVAVQEGIPAQGKLGLDMFRETKIGMTPFAERINFLNAMQTELASTIESLESVQYARVHLAIPRDTVFRADRRKPSASVLVVNRRNARLTPQQVGGIVNLVASAVEELQPDDVTVTDGQGNVLSGAGRKGPELVAGDQWHYRQTVEERLSEKAESMLARVLGPDRAEVRVSAEIDFQDSRETRRYYDPQRRAVARERIETEQSSGGSSLVGGIVGTTAPGGGGGGGSEQERRRENLDTEYLVSESVSEVVMRGASISRLSVAAFVHLPEEEDGAVRLNLAQLEQVIEDAIGLDRERGDSLQIVQTEFEPVMAGIPALDDITFDGWKSDALRYGVIAFLGLTMFLIARSILRPEEEKNKRKKKSKSIDIEGAAAELVDAANKKGPDALLENINSFVEEKPELAGRLLEGWIHGEE